MELLPCPFCGGTSVTVEEGTTYRWAVATCVDCGATASEVRAVPDVVKTQELALAEWNLRSSPASVPGGWELVPAEILDRFQELNPSNYDHDDVCALNAWAVELVLAAAPTPPVSEDKDKIIAAANALENIASTSSSTRIRRVANAALTAIRARRNHG